MPFLDQFLPPCIHYFLSSFSENRLALGQLSHCQYPFYQQGKQLALEISRRAATILVFEPIFFVTILYTVLHRLMGLYWLTVSRPLYFRIRAIRVWFRYSGTCWQEKIFLTSFLTESPTSNQNLLKNPACRPSAQGALKGFMVFRASHISLSEGQCAMGLASSLER